jgi:hypothetical protein
MTNREIYINYITDKLSTFSSKINTKGKIGLFDSHKHAENTYCGFLNILYDWNLENANHEKPNTPGIDLIDYDNKIIIQVSDTATLKKVNDALNKSKQYDNYNFKFVSISKDTNRLKLKKFTIPELLQFDPKKDIYDNAVLLNEIQYQKIDKIKKIYDFCVQECESVEKTELCPKVDICHLPQPTTALIGRKTELSQLTQRFTDGKTRLAIIVAAGGIGKSALTDEWLQYISEQNYYDKTHVFGWSFYAQGTHTSYTNSEEFFSKVLLFLGVTEIPKDEIEKARTLVKELQKQPCLLILDGLEPLQYAQNLSAMNGELQDSALKEFILQFRQMGGKSFVLFSSRQPLIELNKWQESHYLSLDLKTLPHKDGAELLKVLGAIGRLDERQKISQDLNGHALSLVLMGHLLSEHYQGDCYYAKKVPPLTSASGNSDAEKDSRHAVRVLNYYDSLQDAASRCFLQLLGLFDRPMNTVEKAVLIAKANHAKPLRALMETQWQAIEQRLENSGLLLGKKGSFERLEWDTHPIIRSFFGEKFKENHPEAFQQAHLVLFEYYQKVPEQEFGKFLPDTLDEMQPLYRAVAHGCLADRYAHAFKIYYERIDRNDEAYATNKLGAYSYTLSTLSKFFPNNWDFPPVKSGINEAEQALLLAEALFCLMYLGRLSEAVICGEAGIKLEVNRKDWVNSNITAQNLADLYLLLGKINQASWIAKKAISYAEYIPDTFPKILSYSCFAHIEYRKGNIYGASILFQQAETLESEHENIYLTSLEGFNYSILLLDTFMDKKTLKTVQIRANYSLQIVIEKNWLLSIALDKLILARIASLNNDLNTENLFSLAVQSIEEAKAVQFIPQFYLHRADFYLTYNQLNPVLADLNSAFEIIERCGMKLYEVDYLLIHGRYCLATSDIASASEHYEEAKQLISETGYHLRDAELDLFAAQICQYTKKNLHAKTEDDYLQKAKKRIEEIGQWGLMPRWKKISEQKIY